MTDSATEDSAANSNGGTTRAMAPDAKLLPGDLGDFAPAPALAFALAAARFYEMHQRHPAHLTWASGAGMGI